eukprot:TRINITY_DN15510_c0_g1_i1.p1 TRINITY_DN15510_c0_g1~~TRINITY_DN15510_c0_g1_i1.p1  ORF type:complete len:636 (-),score=124.05 TRINITY_DN15510_c0_g1_i1:213-2033(-)
MVGGPGVGQMGMGGPVPATLRPGTMMGPPGTAAQQGPPGTRLGTRQNVGSRNGLGTRQGTAMQPMGVGAHTEVNITDRPMTMQGLSGMKTGSLGPKRQVYDKTYYMLELRKRCVQLGEEVAKMNTEINDISQGNQLYHSLEKRYDTLVKTVRSLEGDLADHNLATDKQRTDTRPEEVHHMYMIMKQQNDEQRSDIDQIFLETKSHEEEIQRMNGEIAAITRASEERLNELHPDQRREYDSFREENNQLMEDISTSRDELDQVNGHLATLENRLQNDVLRSHMQQLLAARKESAERLEALTIEAQQCSLSVPEQRDLLLNRVKSDNTEIVAAEKRLSELKLEKEKIRAQISEVAADTQERRDDNDQHKYEILFAKDQEMTTFIDSFDASKAEEEEKLKAKQESICRLLDNISKAMALQNVSPEGHLRDMEDELEFKSKELQNSETTQNRLEAELTKRQGELDKIESLDVKITEELRQVETKMKQYEEEIENKFDKLEDMRAAGHQELQALSTQRHTLESTVSALRQQVGVLRLRHDTKKQQLLDDEQACNLEAQEKKIGQFGQTMNTLRMYITQRNAETDYQTEKTNCIDISQTLNKMLLERRLPVV